LWQVNTAILIAYGFWVMRGTAYSYSRSTQTRRKGGQLWEDLLRTVSSAGPVLLAGTFLIYGLEWLAVMGFLPTMLVEEYGLNPGRASVLTATMVAANIPGNLFGGWLFHRGCRQWKLIALSSILMGSCSLGIYSSELSFLIRYISCLVFFGAAGLLAASVLGGAPAYAPSPHQVATTYGLIIQGGQLGQAIGPPILALMVSAGGGWKSAPWLLGGAAAVGVAISLGLALLEARQAKLSGNGSG
jgi:hypothetical protein